MTIRAAGVMLLCGSRALFVRRADTGEWAFPGGHIEDGETAEEAAERELREELGPSPHGKPRLLTRRVKDGIDFTTFVAKVEDEFIPTLDAEHTAWCWADLSGAPQPLHPGVMVALARLDADELGVAHLMAAGELVSPQKIGGFWLWKLRITGTGMAWRSAEKDKDGKVTRGEEFAWRDQSLYLTPEFLARCNGLPVTFIHSDGKTDSKEWAQRAVGTVFVPFIENDEIWSISKIYDDAANDLLMNEQFSTSPTVFFGPEGSGTKIEVDGETLLIENKPALLDSIALVPLGVWDKGGPAAGIVNHNLDTQEAHQMAEEGKQDAAKMDAKLDAIMDSLKSAHSRMDAMEADAKSRKDAEEAEAKEREEREDKTRKDAAHRDSARKDRFGKRKDGESYKAYCDRHDADEKAMCDAMCKDGADEKEARDAARKDRKDAEEAEMREDETFAEWAKEEEGESEHKDKKDARKDGEDKPKEEEMKPDARHDAQDAEIASLKSQIAALTTRFTPVSADDRNALASAQSRADGVAGLFGTRASPPIPGEAPIEYRRRLANDFKKHSARYKDKNLGSLDGDMLGLVEEQIYADAASAARSDSRATAGALIPIREPDETGRMITRWTGDSMAWRQVFMSGAQVGRIRSPAEIRSFR